jgi:hypothetical protein
MSAGIILKNASENKQAIAGKPMKFRQENAAFSSRSVLQPGEV